MPDEPESRVTLIFPLLSTFGRLPGVGIKGFKGFQIKQRTLWLVHNVPIGQDDE